MSKNCLDCAHFKEYYSLSPRMAHREPFGRCIKSQKIVDIQDSCKSFTDKENNAEINLSTVIKSLNRTLTDIKKIKLFLERCELK